LNTSDDLLYFSENFQRTNLYSIIIVIFYKLVEILGVLQLCSSPATQLTFGQISKDFPRY